MRSNTYNSEKPTPDIKSPRTAALVFFLALIFFAVLSFRVVLPRSAVLFTTDDNMGALMLRKQALPYGFRGWWFEHVLVGIEEMANLSWTNLLLWLLPIRWFTNWIHAADLVLATICLALFLRYRRVGWLGCAMGGLTAFWLGSNFTLTYAGHIGKFGVLLFASLTLWLTERAVARRRWENFILLGGAIGAMFLEQADVALFFSLFLGPYFLFAIWRENCAFDRKTFGWVALTGLVALLVATRSLWLGYQGGVQNVAAVQQEGPRAKWEFLTQWSWPPEESIDFVAPGYMGWRSGEPNGPYWGRMGRSAEWESTRQGFQNFKLENQYMGFIPLALAIVAVVAAFTRKNRYRVEVLFWGIAAVLSLLLSFGKYFPLYRIFAMLPVISSIRNPNKFLQVFQMTLGVLSALGVQVMAEQADGPDAWRSRIKAGAAAVTGLLLLTAFSAISSMPKEAMRFAAEGWGQYSDVIVALRTRALWHAAIMGLLGTAGFFLLDRFKSARARNAVLLSACMIVAADSLLLGRQYIQRIDCEAFDPNPVVTFLKKADPGRRVALATQQGFYNFWLTYTFPYEGIRCVNVAQMPRMPTDYETFLKNLRRNTLRLWELFAVQYVVMPSAMWSQAKNDPNWSRALQPVFYFNSEPSQEGHYIFREATAVNAQHVILEMQRPAPFVVPIGSWQASDDDSALKKLAAPSHNPLEVALVSASDSEGLRPLSESGPHGNVRFLAERPGYRRFQVSLDRPGVVRISQRYTQDWKAELDRRPTRLLRTDYLFQGIEVPAGLHEIILRYAPPMWPLVVQLVGMALCAIAVIAQFIPGRAA